MLLRKCKQGGFISAELGIGILVISLLTIMGFLAAKDLDDEISRSPKKGLAFVEAIRNTIDAGQESVDNGSYSDAVEKHSHFARAVVTELGLNKNPEVWTDMLNDENGRNHVKYGNNNDRDITLHVNTSAFYDLYIGIEINTGDACAKYLPELKKTMPRYIGNAKCGNNGADITQRIMAGQERWVSEG